MKVLLTRDVEKLGWLGDIVDVKTGYARNYLLPQRLATIPTEDNIKALADEKSRRAELRLEEKKKIMEAAANVNGAEVVLAMKANEQGHLFGSVSQRAIAENLRGQGFYVADEVVVLPEHIKEIGTHEISLRYRISGDGGTVTERSAKVRLVVVAETQTQAQDAPQAQE
ncbi:MAG TPA: 50S ribosomal protein L9 [Sedimentisphaerales bacterium]|nr:50S ribosomal protein L9 [Sedimentisphaerales bacterium]